jgi:hypothetical protein
MEAAKESEAVAHLVLGQTRAARGTGAEAAGELKRAAAATSARTSLEARISLARASADARALKTLGDEAKAKGYTLLEKRTR